MIDLSLKISYTSIRVIRISDSVVEEILRQGGSISDEQIAEFRAVAEKTGRPLQQVALDAGTVNNRQLAEALSERTGIPFIEIDPKSVPVDVLKRIPEHIAKQYNVVLFGVDEHNNFQLAMEDPDDVQALNFIQKEIGYNIKIYIATHENILESLGGYRGSLDEELGEVVDIQTETDKDIKPVSEDDIAEDSPIAQTVNLLLEYAVKANASDIHIEPREDYVQIRYRIDGVLQEVNKLPRNVHGAMVSRIKILANLKIDERRVPQDGRFKISIAGKQYALRVSTLPIADGEKVVMRILDESNRTITLEQLGYWGLSLRNIQEAMTQPNGMILVTGPTGSGKSTSLFSMLSILNTADVNISTIEDPVEYKIPGVNQVQTNPKAGMTFASGLRALLRQDPNIIMVGEIRDGETANLGVQAALTGHLVFSTLHTNNAATSLPRLLDMEIEPFLIASTVKAVVGQRLVRRLCNVCKERYKPDHDEIKSIEEILHLKDGDVTELHRLEQEAVDENIGKGKEMSTSTSTIEYLWRASAEGCQECNNTGFSGRMGIYEVLDVSVPVQKMITANATSNEIQEQAISEGMLTMQTDGLIKAFRGMTTVEEVLRVTREQ